MCVYDDTKLPRTSECSNGLFTYKYSYDARGRTISYSKRRIAIDGESAEQRNYLAQGYKVDAAFFYTKINTGIGSSLKHPENCTRRNLRDSSQGN